MLELLVQIEVLEKKGSTLVGTVSYVWISNLVFNAHELYYSYSYIIYMYTAYM